MHIIALYYLLNLNSVTTFAYKSNYWHKYYLTATLMYVLRANIVKC